MTLWGRCTPQVDEVSPIAVQTHPKQRFGGSGWCYMSLYSLLCHHMITQRPKGPQGSLEAIAINA